MVTLQIRDISHLLLKDSLRNRLYCSDMRFRPLLGVLFVLFLSLLCHIRNYKSETHAKF